MSGKRRGKLIAVIGLDGSGKTTLARGLVEELQAHGYRAVYVHVWPQLFPSQKSQAPATRDLKKSREREARKEFPRLPGWRAWALFLLMFYILRIRLPRLLRRYDFVVCDRFAHDLATYLRLRGQRRPVAWLLRASASLRPEAIFWLRVPIEALVERKDSELEHSPSVYSQWDRLYEEVMSEVPGWEERTNRLDGLRSSRDLLREALHRLA